MPASCGGDSRGAGSVYVDITGGVPGWDNTRDDRIVITSINTDRVTMTKEIRFDTDPLRHAPRRPYRAGCDDDGADSAWCVPEAAPPQTRWALLRDLCDRHPGAIGPAVWAELADLDMQVRPWMHTAEDTTPTPGQREAL